MLCRLCSHNSVVPRMVVRGYTVGACSNCGLMQLTAPSTEFNDPELYGAEYFKRGKYRSDAADEAEQRRRLALLSAAGISHGSKILDLGCATGSFIRAAKSEYEMWGVELSVDAVALAKDDNKELSDRIVCGAIEELVFPEHFFDAVVGWDVIEHVEDPLAVVKKIRKLLQPGGTVILSTPNSGALAAKILGKRWAFMTPPEHICYFSRETVTTLLEQAGFSIARWSSCGKWVNIGFLLYKLRKSSLVPIPEWLIHKLQSIRLGTVPLYVPTGDIQYITARAE